MIHLGSITEINGAEIEPVDVITGGSPCQDLSIAGKRKGLSGERSGLFMEQIRVVKEMRENDRRKGRTAQFCRPRFMVWENVAGAFTSNGGKDFQAVLTEIIRIAEPEAPDVPLPAKGKWPHAGELHDEMGRWSVAYRLIDAKFWGVPQRRKRIALVADFASGGAANILFEQYLGSEPGQEIRPFTESMSGNPEQSTEEREDTSTTAGDGAPKSIGGGTYDIRISSDGTKNWRAHCYETDISRALDTGGEDPDSNHGGVAITYGICGFESNSMKSANPNSGIYKADTARTLDSQGGSPACNQGGMAVVCLNDQGGSVMSTSEEETATLRAQTHGHEPAVCYSQDRFDKYTENDKTPALLHTGGTYGGAAKHLLYQEEIGALCSRDEKGIGNQYVQEGKCIIQRSGD